MLIYHFFVIFHNISISQVNVFLILTGFHRWFQYFVDSSLNVSLRINCCTHRMFIYICQVCVCIVKHRVTMKKGWTYMYMVLTCPLTNAVQRDLNLKKSKYSALLKKSLLFFNVKTMTRNHGTLEKIYVLFVFQIPFCGMIL